MKLSLLLTGLGAAAAASTLVIVYVVQKPSMEGSAVSPPVVETIPTPQYLLAHPDALKEAEQNCRDGNAPSPLYCSNVHKAENLRLANQYRQGLQPGTAPK